MELTLHSLAVETFVPMLRTLAELLDKGSRHAAAKNFDFAVLAQAQLAPDMYPLSRQVEIACDMAKDATAHLAGVEAPRFAEVEPTLESLKARITRTIEYVQSLPERAFAEAAARDMKVPLPSNAALVMTGTQFLRDWALAHFYFHVVTAYDILRHNGVELGKRDFLSRAAVYIRPA